LAAAYDFSRDADVAFVLARHFSLCHPGPPVGMPLQVAFYASGAPLEPMLVWSRRPDTIRYGMTKKRPALLERGGIDEWLCAAFGCSRHRLFEDPGGAAVH